MGLGCGGGGEDGGGYEECVDCASSELKVSKKRIDGGRQRKDGPLKVTLTDLGVLSG